VTRTKASGPGRTARAAVPAALARVPTVFLAVFLAVVPAVVVPKDLCARV